MPRLKQLLLEQEDLLNQSENFPGNKFYLCDTLDHLGQEVKDILNSFNLGLNSFRYFRLPSGASDATKPHSDSAFNPCFAMNLVLKGSLIVHFYESDETNTRIQTGPEGVQFPVLLNPTPPTESVWHYTGDMRVLNTEVIHSADTTISGEDLALISFIPVPQYSFELACRILNK
jgi:hypothetical protein